ncbi:cytochrome p450 71b25 [Botrytis cinerea]
MDILQTKPILTAVSVVGVTLLGYFFTRLYAAQMLMVKLQTQGCPVAPGHSFFFEHIFLLGKMPKCPPKDAHYQRMFGEIYRDHFESTGVYYMDLWRMTAISIMQTNTLISARKADPMPRFFKPIVGGPVFSICPKTRGDRGALNRPDVDVKPEKLDPDFKVFATRQIRLFVFSGHDSLSSTICYIYHLLSKNVEAMRKAIEEHDLVFGRQVDGASELLETKPHLANDLPYTTAVIKETLRHFHAASSSRQGYPGVNLYDEQGTACPANHTVCFTDRVGMHYAPKYWVRPEEFLPERWLVDPGHEL